MAKNKSDKAARQSTELTRKERKEMREKLSSISEVTPEELIELVRKDANGQLAVNVLLDALWPKFKQAFQIAMPAKSIGTPDKVYQQQLESYRKWTAGIKSIARYWYIAGMQHEKNHKDLLDILDPAKDAEAPEEAAQENAQEEAK